MEVKQGILNILENGGTTELPFLPLSTYEEIFKELGFTDLHNYDTNVLQVDFWWTITGPDELQYRMNGSFWYGKFTFESLH